MRARFHLHASTQAEHKVEGRLLLDVVVLEGATVFELLAGEDESLLIWGNTFLVLDLGLDVFNRVGLLDVEGDGLSRKGLDEDLHTTSESEDQMESGLLLDVVVGKGSAVLKLLTGEDKSLLIWWDSLLVLDLGFDVLNGVRWLDIEGDGLTSESLHKNLHSSTQPQDQVQSALLLDIVVRQGSSIFQLLPSEDETLLVRGNAFLVLDKHLLWYINSLLLPGSWPLRSQWCPTAPPQV